MRKTIMSGLAGLIVGVGVAAAPAAAGPPLICFPYQVGDHACLPWGDEPFEKSGSFDTKTLQSRALAALSPDAPVIARMETIRRAALYLDRSDGKAQDLLAALAFRALDAEAAGQSEAAAAAYFDAGFFAATYAQLGGELPGKPGLAEGVQGYAWVKHAIALSGGSPDMHFAAAVMLVDRSGVRNLRDAHVKAAKEGAKPGSLLATNLASHAEIMGL